MNGTPIREVDVATAAAAVAAGAPLLDVRQPDEYDEIHAVGAQLIPLGELPDRLDEVPRDATIHVICRSGARSLKAAELLASEGIEAVNVAGGTLAWVDASLPSEQG